MGTTLLTIAIISGVWFVFSFFWSIYADMNGIAMREETPVINVATGVIFTIAIWNYVLVLGIIAIVFSVIAAVINIIVSVDN